jgi:hypothetical protein
MSGFTKAVRKKSKLRMGISGPSGSGKTMAALSIAKGLGGKIALIDTERGSASLYADPVRLGDGSVWTPPAFDTMEMIPPFTPEKFVNAIEEAESAGYDILIIDSTTHEWNGSGGVLELVKQVAKAKFGGNDWSAWSELTPRHQKFIDAILNSNMHIIGTMRSKTETDQITDDRGKKKVVKLGMKAEQREGTDYEYTVVLDLIHDGHYATSSKDRTGLFGGDPEKVSEATGKKLLNWLNSGAELKPEPAAAKTPPPTTNVTPPADDTYSKAHSAIMTAKTADGLQKIADALMVRVQEGKLTQDDGSTLLALCESQQAALGIKQKEPAPI